MTQRGLAASPAAALNDDERRQRLAACYAFLLDLAKRRNASSNARVTHSGEPDAPSTAKHQE